MQILQTAHERPSKLSIAFVLRETVYETLLYLFDDATGLAGSGANNA